MGKVFRNLGRPDDVVINEPIKWVCEECKLEVWSADIPQEIKSPAGHVCKFVKLGGASLKKES